MKDQKDNERIEQQGKWQKSPKTKNIPQHKNVLACQRAHIQDQKETKEENSKGNNKSARNDWVSPMRLH